MNLERIPQRNQKLKGNHSGIMPQENVQENLLANRPGHSCAIWPAQQGKSTAQSWFRYFWSPSSGRQQSIPFCSALCSSGLVIGFEEDFALRNRKRKIVWRSVVLLRMREREKHKANSERPKKTKQARERKRMREIREEKGKKTVRGRESHSRLSSTAKKKNLELSNNLQRGRLGSILQTSPNEES